MKIDVIVLSEKEIRSVVALDEEAVEIISDGFSYLAQNKVTLPPILRIDVEEHNGEVDVKTAYIHGLDNFAIKIAAGFFDNRELGLPTGSGMMVLVSAITGRPLAILLDNGYLTNVRTGCAGAIAAKYLAPSTINTAGVIGSGTQARYQVKALRLVRDFSTVMVYGIVPDEVEEYAGEMSEELGVEVIISQDPEEVVRMSDIVVTTTPSKEPYLKSDWLHPGLHITCMGSDSEDKQEIQADVFGKADRIVCDRRSQVFRLGELHHALEAGVITEDDEIYELGEVIENNNLGRVGEEEITICDLTGVGVQDTQIARLAYQKTAKLKG